MKQLNNSVILLIVLTLSACEVLNEVASSTNTTVTKPKLTNEEVISGLKEALTVGITNAVNLSSVTDGFWKNDLIRIPFPEDALKVKEKATEWGLGNKVLEFETTLNRAAEEASKQALPIFKDAILNMSIQDGFAILNNGNGAATNYLRSATTAKLQAAFLPIVKNAISKVKLTDLWNPIINKYNNAMFMTGGEKINPNLDNYITERAIVGLFKLVEIEENKIRKDPVARVTDLLKKVFGSQN